MSDLEDAGPFGLDKIIGEIRRERQRQVVIEGFSRLHDDDHKSCELTLAAMAYCQAAAIKHEDTSRLSDHPPTYWPWEAQWWKPKDRRSNLVRAAALIVAEIERLDRAAP